jgi:copper chaperone NosL
MMRTILLSLVLMLLSACQDSTTSNAQALPPVHIESDDECHLCGMSIKPFPGPKGEALGGDSSQVRKFCSTRDLLAWALQPEQIRQGLTLYVHDMSQTDWKSPEDTAFIDARTAIYVVGSSQTGAMGSTLASFGSAADADRFIEAYGGEKITFVEITPATLSGLNAAVGDAMQDY